MATEKTVQINATMGETFKIESKIRDHVVYVDQPKPAGGTDAGPTPLEYLFLSLGACVLSIARIKANQEKIALRGMEVEVSGPLNVEVLLGKSQDTRCGFEGITAKVKIDADMTPEEKAEFLHAVDLRCPVSDNLQNPTPVTVELAE
jgi:uncharacterized OsmC-like protein